MPAGRPLASRWPPPLAAASPRRPGPAGRGAPVCSSDQAPAPASPATPGGTLPAPLQGADAGGLAPCPSMAAALAAASPRLPGPAGWGAPVCPSDRALGPAHLATPSGTLLHPYRVQMPTGDLSSAGRRSRPRAPTALATPGGALPRIPTGCGCRCTAGSPYRSLSSHPLKAASAVPSWLPARWRATTDLLPTPPRPPPALIGLGLCPARRPGQPLVPMAAPAPSLCPRSELSSEAGWRLTDLRGEHPSQPPAGPLRAQAPVGRSLRSACTTLPADKPAGLRWRSPTAGMSGPGSANGLAAAPPPPTGAELSGPVGPLPHRAQWPGAGTHLRSESTSLICLVVPKGPGAGRT
jgi:hypothetical protein